MEVYYEEIYIYDIKNVVMFGSCGILDKSINECELIIPTFSYRDEGTSYHYVEPSDYIEIKNSGDLIGIFEELKIPYRKGKIWTTDAMYRETINNINKRREEGCIAGFLISVQAFTDLVFLLIVSVNIILGIIQEIRAKNMIDNLRLMSAPVANVIREGVKMVISG